jgi:hypothetical protein
MFSRVAIHTDRIREAGFVPDFGPRTDLLGIVAHYDTIAF